MIRGLSDGAGMEEAREALRALVEEIVLVPVPAEDTEDGRPHLAIDLHGALAGLLRLATGLPARGGQSGMNGKKSAGADCQIIDII